MIIFIPESCQNSFSDRLTWYSKAVRHNLFLSRYGKGHCVDTRLKAAFSLLKFVFVYSGKNTIRSVLYLLTEFTNRCFIKQQGRIKKMHWAKQSTHHPGENTVELILGERLIAVWILGFGIDFDPKWTPSALHALNPQWRTTRNYE